MNHAAISVQGLRKSFGENQAVQGVSFDVGRGEIFSLLGPNGAGKTTTISMLSCLLRPEDGDAYIMGHSIRGDAMGVKSVLGVVPQEIALYEDLTARENLRFAATLLGTPGPEERVECALADVDLRTDAETRVRGFSAGMRRRLGLARLLLRPPRLLLLDEPYASFDADGVGRLNEFIAELKAAGSTVLVATHDLDRGAVVLDRVVRLEQGLIVSEARFGKVRRPLPAEGEDRAVPAAPAPPLRAAEGGSGR